MNRRDLLAGAAAAAVAPTSASAAIDPADAEILKLERRFFVRARQLNIWFKTNPEILGQDYDNPWSPRAHDLADEIIAHPSMTLISAAVRLRVLTCDLWEVHNDHDLIIWRALQAVEKATGGRPKYAPERPPPDDA